jgi:hypothetical protein
VEGAAGAPPLQPLAAFVLGIGGRLEQSAALPGLVEAHPSTQPVAQVVIGVRGGPVVEGDAESAFVHRCPSEQQAGLAAGGEREPCRVVDDRPASVTGDAVPADLGACERLALERLDGVAPDRCDLHRRVGVRVRPGVVRGG